MGPLVKSQVTLEEKCKNFNSNCPTDMLPPKLQISYPTGQQIKYPARPLSK